MKDQMEPIGENEQVEWDGLRRRKTTTNSAAPGSLRRQKTNHPPLGMAHFPEDDPLWDGTESRPASTDVHGGSGLHGGFLSSFRRKSSQLNHSQNLNVRPPPGEGAADMLSRPVTTIAAVPPKAGDSDTAYHGAQPTDGSMEMGHVLGLPHGLTPPDRREHSRPITWANDVEDRPKTGSRGPSAGNLAPGVPTPPIHSTKRQFSFQNVFHRNHHKDGNHQHDSTLPPMSPGAMSFTEEVKRPTSRLGLASRGSNKDKLKAATEEERLGLVKGDSSNRLPLPDYDEHDEDWELEVKPREIEAEVTPLGLETSRTPLIHEDQEEEEEEEEYTGVESPRPPLPAKNSPQLRPGAGGRWKDSEAGAEGSKGGGGGPAFI